MTHLLVKHLAEIEKSSTGKERYKQSLSYQNNQKMEYKIKILSVLQVKNKTNKRQIEARSFLRILEFS